MGSREASPGEPLPPPRMFWGCSILIPSRLEAAFAQKCLVHLHVTARHSHASAQSTALVGGVGFSRSWLQGGDEIWLE